MLKVDMHMHCKDDPCDRWIPYSADELMERYGELGFDVISITPHHKMNYNKSYFKSAKKYGLLLIPGVELSIEGVDVLAYNIKPEEIKKLKTIEDLKKIRRKDTLISAPHPFIPSGQCLRNKLIEHIDLFDAVEHTFFYQPFFKFWNVKARKVAEKHNKAFVGNGDVHHLWQVGYNYSLVDAKKTIPSVFKAIKNNKVKLVTKPIPFGKFAQVVISHFKG